MLTLENAKVIQSAMQYLYFGDKLMLENEVSEIRVLDAQGNEVHFYRLEKICGQLNADHILSTLSAQKCTYNECVECDDEEYVDYDEIGERDPYAHWTTLEDYEVWLIKNQMQK